MNLLHPVTDRDPSSIAFLELPAGLKEPSPSSTITGMPNNVPGLVPPAEEIRFGVSATLEVSNEPPCEGADVKFCFSSKLPWALHYQ